jgi:hypothetical protein
VSDKLSRILRTLIQAGGATVIVQIILAFVVLSAEQVAALTGGLTWVLAIIQNAIEAKAGATLLGPSE